MSSRAKIIWLLIIIFFIVVAGILYYYYYRSIAGSLESAWGETTPLSTKEESRLQPPKIFTQKKNDSHLPARGTQTGAAIIDDQLNLELPDGFFVNIFAEGLSKPRFMSLDPTGQLWLADIGAGTVVYLPDQDNNGRADSVRTVLKGLNRPNSLAFFENYLYVAETDKVTRFIYQDGRVTTDSGQVVVADLPHGEGHFTRTIIFGADGKMYLSIGSSCNVCLEKDKRRATVMQFNPDGSEGKIFTGGLRNSVGLTTHPLNGEIWATDNGRDWLGDDLPPEEINILKQGGFYGWPYCYGDKVLDPKFGDEDICVQSIAPRLQFQAHSAPLGLTFYVGDLFPEEYQNDLLVAYHGSWNRSSPVGYKVARLDYQEGRYQEKDFLSGFLQTDGKTSGRPVDVLVGKRGELFVTDDKGGRVFRITYAAPR